MFASRDRRRGAAGVVDVAFTDRHGGVSTPPFDSLDLSRSAPGRDEELATNLALLAAEFEVAGFATMRQVQGADVAVVDSVDADQPTCDGLVTDVPGVALCVRVGDCVPLVLADPEAGVVGVAHVGRRGVVTGIVAATLEAMRGAGAAEITGWVGPHVCGGCYEVPAQMRAEVSAVVPAAFACTTWGAPSVDIGAAVRSQLATAGCNVHDQARCTRESPDLYSYRRDGADSGRFAGIVVLRESRDE